MQFTFADSAYEMNYPTNYPHPSRHKFFVHNSTFKDLIYEAAQNCYPDYQPGLTGR